MCLILRRIAPTAGAVCLSASSALGLSSDLSVVPFWDGETSEGLRNRYGGNSAVSSGVLTQRTESVALNGAASLGVATLGSIPLNGSAFTQWTLGPIGSTPGLTQARDLTRYDAAAFSLRNETGEPFTVTYEIKDDRNSNAHVARWSQLIDASTDWQTVNVPLDLGAPGWTVIGNPDLTRASRVTYGFSANQGTAVTGTFFIDDAVFVEPGGSVDVATAPVNVLAERVARRQWDGLWSARHRDTGLVPLHNTSNERGAMNTSSAVLKMLPGAVQRGWVSSVEAEQHVTNLVASLNTMLDQGMYLPQRYVRTTDLSPVPGIGGEESSIDAAFMALALHQYKNSPGVSPALAQAVDDVQNRFNFTAFSDTVGSTRGWKFAYRTDTGLTDGTYNSYSGEPWVISLAAALSDDFHVPIETQWNSAVFRTKDSLTGADDEHLVSTFDQFRPPFVQWLLPMFVDTSDRGHDTYPVLSIAGNPEDNAAAYQRDVNDYFASIGRGELLQPDAGDNGFGNYQQFSAYMDFGDAELFMPWAVTLALLGDPDAESAFRQHLANDLEGPLGLADTAYQATGTNEPYNVRAFLDFWNTSLSTMALVDLLYDEAAGFAALPEVRAALDVVFHLAGDYNLNGQVEQGDLDLVLQNWGLDVAASGVPTGWLNDRPRGVVDQAELDRVLQNWGDSEAPDFGGASVPEPGAAFAIWAVSLWRGRHRSRS